MLQKKASVGGAEVWAYYSEISEADINRNLSDAKKFNTEAEANEFRNTNKLQGWSAIQYNDPGASALRPWELEK